MPMALFTIQKRTPLSDILKDRHVPVELKLLVVLVLLPNLNAFYNDILNSRHAPCSV